MKYMQKNTIFATIMTILAIVPVFLLSTNENAMNILCIMHADFETPGVIQDWAEKSGHHFEICKPYAGENCLTTGDFDFLIIMGGPQGGADCHVVPYLSDEITLIKQAINNDKIVLGFCLGAQLIGEALGAKTEKSPEKEVGVYPISLTQASKNNPILKSFPQDFLSIHWHNDMPGLTENSQVLAYSAGCPRQIVKYSDKIYGFQCHLEITKKGIERMIAECPQDLATSRFTQTEQELLIQDYGAINNSMFDVLDRISELQ